MSFLSPSDASTTTPAQPKVEGAPPPVLGPQGTKPKSKAQRSTFLGSDATPGGGVGQASGNMGGKTLLGSM